MRTMCALIESKFIECVCAIYYWKMLLSTQLGARAHWRSTLPLTLLLEPTKLPFVATKKKYSARSSVESTHANLGERLLYYFAKIIFSIH